MTDKNNMEEARMEEFRKTKIDHIESEFDKKVCESFYRTAQQLAEMSKDEPDDNDDASIEDTYKVTLNGHMSTPPADMLKLDVEIEKKYLELPESLKKQFYALVIENLTQRFCASLVKPHSQIVYVMTTSTNRTFSTASKKFDQWAGPVIVVNLFDNERNCTNDLSGKFHIDIAVIHDINAFEQMKKMCGNNNNS